MEMPGLNVENFFKNTSTHLIIRSINLVNENASTKCCVDYSMHLKSTWSTSDSGCISSWTFWFPVVGFDSQILITV